MFREHLRNSGFARHEFLEFTELSGDKRGAFFDAIASKVPEKLAGKPDTEIDVFLVTDWGHHLPPMHQSPIEAAVGNFTQEGITLACAKLRVSPRALNKAFYLMVHGSQQARDDFKRLLRK